MSTVRAPKPSYLDDIDDKSIVSFSRTTTDVTFYNRAGDAVGTYTIRNSAPSYYVPAISTIGSVDFPTRDVIIKDWKTNNGDQTPLAAPATLPAGSAASVAWSPDGVYLAISHQTTPFLTIYKRSKDTLTKLADPATLPPGNPYSSGQVAWSPNGQYLVTTSATTPFVVIYKRTGDTFTKLANPAVLPSSTGISASWSPDSQYLAITCNSSTAPYGLIMYKRSGDVFTSIGNPTGFAYTIFNRAGWSPSGKYFVIGYPKTGGVAYSIFKQSGDVFTFLRSFIASGTQGYGISWTPDEQYLAMVDSGLGSVFVVYKRAGDSFSKLADPVTLPSVTGLDCDWSKDGKYLALKTSGGLYVYQRSGDTMSIIPSPSTATSDSSWGVDWSPDGKYLAEARGSGNKFAVYKSCLGPVSGIVTRITLVP